MLALDRLRHSGHPDPSHPDFHLADPARRRRRPAAVAVRRGHEVEDTRRQLLPLGRALRGPVAVTFTDAHGLPEAGAPRLR